MVFTNFPNGTTSFGIPQISGQLPLVPDGGQYWFVDSATGSASFAGTYDSPFAALSTAITAAAANDCIVLAAGHAESVIAAGGITVSKAGLQIVGMGTGTKRPTFTFTTSTAATFLVTAAGVNIQNIVGVTGIDQIVSPFVISASGVTMNIEWQDPSSSFQAIRTILTTAAADNLNLTLKTVGITSGGTSPVNAIRLVGADTAMIRLDFYGRASTAVVEFLTTACSNVEVYGYAYNSGVTNGSKNIVDTVTGSTWFQSLYDGAAGSLSTGGSAVSPAAPAQIIAVQEQVALKAAATITNGQTLFTVAGGPITIVAMVSICVTANDGTASTLQYSATPTAGAAQTISGASASLASAAIGASVTLAGTALATAALLNANGPNLIANPGTIMVPAGAITAVVGVGSTTGTWRHYIRYRPLATGVTVS